MQHSKSRFEENAVKKRILIIEDHPIVRKGFMLLINEEQDMCAAGEAEDSESALDLVRKTEADLALVDLSLRDGSGMELIKEIAVKKPGLPILVVSLHEESIYAERVLRAGARGYVMKSEATENILSAIRDVIAGKVYLSEKMKTRILNRLSSSNEKVSFSLESLSDRELEVFHYIGQGKTTKEIAYFLNLSIKTVETYKSHIKVKLQIRDSTELMLRAVEWEIFGS